MSVEQLHQQTIPTEIPTLEVPVIFDVLDAVRGTDDKVQAMQFIDMSGALVFEDVLATMATIGDESQAAGIDYRMHKEFGEYLRKRHGLSQLRTLAANVESADGVNDGLADFYAGKTADVEELRAGQKIITAVQNKYGELQALTNDKLAQAKESLSSLSPRTRRVGSIAVAAAVLSGSLMIPHGSHAEKRVTQSVAAKTAVNPSMDAQLVPAASVENPQEPEFKEVTVQPGDNLSLIAQNNKSNVDAIFSNNRNIIKNPALIYAGQILRVPVGKVALAEVSQVQAATVDQPIAVTETTVVSLPVESKKVVTEPAVLKTRESGADISFDKVPNINGVDKELIRDVVAYLIHQQHLTPTGAAYLTGNFITESGLDPQSRGGGLGQWAGSRLKGMPTDLYGALDFALNVEMDRDGIASDLDELLRDPDATQAQIQDGLRRWERWGIRGRRFEFAQTILSALQA